MEQTREKVLEHARARSVLQEITGFWKEAEIRTAPPQITTPPTLALELADRKTVLQWMREAKVTW
ncbi:MAG: hypothetical protein K9L68_12970 [Spirochaetales bacterium]|nr:hypothetical protein [Spirochaetales bacterium]